MSLLVRGSRRSNSGHLAAKWSAQKFTAWPPTHQHDMGHRVRETAEDRLHVYEGKVGGHAR
jgi:hypothetical protein